MVLVDQVARKDQVAQVVLELTVILVQQVLVVLVAQVALKA